MKNFLHTTIHAVSIMWYNLLKYRDSVAHVMCNFYAKEIITQTSVFFFMFAHNFFTCPHTKNIPPVSRRDITSSLTLGRCYKSRTAIAAPINPALYPSVQLTILGIGSPVYTSGFIFSRRGTSNLSPCLPIPPPMLITSG